MCWFPTEGIKDWAFIVCDMKALFSLSTTFDALDLHCHNFVDQTYWDATPHSRIPAKSVDCKYSLNHHLIHIQGDPTRMSQAIQVQKISKKEDIYDTDGNMAFLRENTNTSITNEILSSSAFLISDRSWENLKLKNIEAKLLPNQFSDLGGTWLFKNSHFCIQSSRPHQYDY